MPSIECYVILLLGFDFYMTCDSPEEHAMPKEVTGQFFVSTRLGKGAGGVVHLAEDRVKIFAFVHSPVHLIILFVKLLKKLYVACFLSQQWIQIEFIDLDPHAKNSF